MKTCTKCKQSKELSEFSKIYKNKDIYRYSCKKCENIYNVSINGIIAKIYGNQKSHSKDRNHSMPTYSKQQFKEWTLSQNNFKELYDLWVKSGYETMKKPSIDRIDDSKGYSFENIRLVTWYENIQKNYSDRRNEIEKRKHKKSCKKVLQYDLNMNFIKEYHSIKEAGRQTKVNDSHISQVTRGLRNTAGKFKWVLK